MHDDLGAVDQHPVLRGRGVHVPRLTLSARSRTEPRRDGFVCASCPEGVASVSIDSVEQIGATHMRVVGRIEAVRSPSDTVVVILVGDHDLSTAPELRSVLTRAIADGPGVVVDLGETTFLDSSILHALIEANLTLQRRNGGPESPSQRLSLRFGSAAAGRNVFEVAGVLDQFGSCESTDIFVSRD